MTTSTEVRRASHADEKVLTPALAAAFTDDPVFGWLVPFGVPNRRRRLEAVFGSFVRSYLRTGKPVYAAAGGSAVALWSPPGTWRLPLSEILRETPSSLYAFRTRLPVALQTLNLVESKHPRNPQHWYLGYLGTEPAHQGQGYGAALLRSVLDGCDADGVPAYLESSNERNLTLYKRHGFEIVEQINAPHGGPPIWRMWRDPH